MVQRQGIAMWAAIAFMALFMPALLLLSRPCAAQGVRTKINPRDGARMVFIPAGAFLMGGTSYPDEKPPHKVYLDGYWIYQTPVTVAQYRTFCEATKHEMPFLPEGEGRGDHPIVNVTWSDAQAYCAWAGMSLPTEAQWEKAARGTDGREYPWGNEWDKSRCQASRKDVFDGGSTVSVGSLASGASPYGVLDMEGNVAEWCADWYAETYYRSAPDKNPTGPEKGTDRVVRGSPWFGNLSFAYRAANRNMADPHRGLDCLGFRCVCRVASR